MKTNRGRCVASTGPVLASGPAKNENLRFGAAADGGGGYGAAAERAFLWLHPPCGVRIRMKCALQ